MGRGWFEVFDFRIGKFRCKINFVVTFFFRMNICSTCHLSNGTFIQRDIFSMGHLFKDRWKKISRWPNGPLNKWPDSPSCGGSVEGLGLLKGCFSEKKVGWGLWTDQTLRANSHRFDISNSARARTLQIYLIPKKFRCQHYCGIPHSWKTSFGSWQNSNIGRNYFFKLTHNYVLHF